MTLAVIMYRELKNDNRTHLCAPNIQTKQRLYTICEKVIIISSTVSCNAESQFVITASLCMHETKGFNVDINICT